MTQEIIEGRFLQAAEQDSYSMRLARSGGESLQDQLTEFMGALGFSEEAQGDDADPSRSLEFQEGLSIQVCFAFCFTLLVIGQR